MGIGSKFQGWKRDWGLRAPYMPGEDEAKEQYEWDRNAMQDSMDANRHSQTNPWGTRRWEGDHQITELNPWDQYNLNLHRDWTSQIGQALPGLTNEIAQMGLTPFNLPPVHRPGKSNIPDPSEYQDLNLGGLPGFHNLDFERLNLGGLPNVSAGLTQGDFRGVNPTQFTQLDLRGMPNVSQGQFQNLNLGGLQGVNAAGANAGNVVDRSGMAVKRSGQLAALQEAIAGMPQLSRPEDFGAESERISQSVYDRAANLLSPQLERQRDSRENDLWQRGLQGTEAGYSDLDRLDEASERQFNDLALASVLAGSNEHQRLADLNSRNRGQLMGEQFGLFDAGGAELGDIETLNRGGSQDVMDAFSRQLGLRGQQFGERLAGTQIANQNANDIFGQQMGMRGQAFNERMAGTDVANQIARDRFGQDVTGANIDNQNIQNLFGNQFAMRGQGVNEQMLMNQVANGIQQMLGDDAMNRRGQMFGEEQASNNVFNQNRNNRFNQMMGREDMRWGHNMDRYNIATEQRAMRLAEQQAMDARRMQAMGMLAGNFVPPGTPQFAQNPTYGLAAPDVLGMAGDRAAMQGQMGQGRLNMLANIFGPSVGKWFGGKIAGGDD